MGWGVVRLHPSSYIGCRSSRRCFQCLFEVFTRRRGLRAWLHLGRPRTVERETSSPQSTPPRPTRVSKACVEVAAQARVWRRAACRCCSIWCVASFARPSSALQPSFSLDVDKEAAGSS